MIAGPCAAESQAQIHESAQEALAHNIEIMRMSLWKPRTKPGFEGLGEEGVPLLTEVSEMGLIPATEVIMPEHAESAIDEIIKNTHDGRILIWLGSRNQNQFIQRAIGSLIQGEDRVALLIKNQMWPDKKHWMGIIEHVIDGGADPSQLILCHRGFAPGTNGFRNTPDLQMAMEVKRETGLPVIGDPSHIGGSTERVIEVAQAMIEHREGDGIGFDGLMIEAHPNPDNAITDNGQQLTWDDFSRVQEHVLLQAA